MPDVAGAQPQQAAVTGQPPFGSSPATGPTQNAGFQAQGQAGLAMAVKLLERLVPMLGSSTPAGQDVLESIKRLAKHIPPGAVNQAAEQQQMQNLMMQRQKMMGMHAQPAPQPATPQPAAA